MTLLLLTACTATLEPVALDWFVEEIGDCDDNGDLEWDAPDDILSLSVRRRLDDGRTVFVDGTHIIADTSGDVLFTCDPGSRFTVTYALMRDE